MMYPLLAIVSMWVVQVSGSTCNGFVNLHCSSHLIAAFCNAAWEGNTGILNSSAVKCVWDAGSSQCIIDTVNPATCTVGPRCATPSYVTDPSPTCSSITDNDYCNALLRFNPIWNKCKWTGNKRTGSCATDPNPVAPCYQ